MVETYRGSVFSWECDNVGHMNVRYYVAKFDEASWQLMAILGLTPSYFREHNKSVVATEQHIKYINELLPGDLIVVRSRVEEIKKSFVKFNHQMINSQTMEIAADMTVVAVHLDLNTRRPSSIPSEISDRIINKISEHSI